MASIRQRGSTWSLIVELPRENGRRRQRWIPFQTQEAAEQAYEELQGEQQRDDAGRSRQAFSEVIAELDAPRDLRGNIMVKKSLRSINPEPESSASVSRLTITPSLAADWIAKNTKNRPVRQSVVMRYAEDMATRRWRINGATIVMSDKGNILDGQHRLLACIRSGVAFESFVASGVDEETFVTIDSGVSRKFSDVVSILGYPDASRLSAMTRGWWEYQKRGKMGTTGREAQPTTQELQDTLLSNTDIFLACLRGTRIVQKLFGGATSAWGVSWISFGLIDEVDRDFFFERLGDGQNLAAGDPVYALRRLLQNDESRDRAMPPNLLLAYIIKAWNKFRGRETVDVLIMRASDPMPEPL